MTVAQIFIYKEKKLSARGKELCDDFARILPNSKIVENEYKHPESEELATIRIHEDIEPQFILFDIFKKQVVFKIINYRSFKSISKDNSIESGSSQLVLSNFTTDLGIKIANIFMDIFPLDMKANQVANFSVHKDFVYFRFYRFAINLSNKKVKNTKTKFLQLGPQLTLRVYRFKEEIDGKSMTYEYKKYIKNKNLL
ncbi:rpf1 [Ecytonucleospora hepatopenaei]|uniref:Rpf1 n=1 Tax=Ecytonucleospora hepatopenaei TaxID=646526 RepID=A0A1W0E7Y4_9MICR|nr:rpf1 [Ecytonucleospora hepatopenaei]